ncbi:hypothetical protein CRG98_020599 [Punica granatum]|uniref:WPP domain-associated protein n=1 Tax=Punica granatum TaxID=22663 RepID=A0A2I0JS20_PUNGR|nr:hypothetical protein CRG98_020599 [Punica granatum]
MVSDSVIKGMVGAVEQEAAGRIAQKESEISKLKERLLSYNLTTAEYGVLECPSKQTSIAGSTQSKSNLGLSVRSLEDDRFRDLLVSCKTEAGKQLTELKGLIHTIERRNSFDSINPGLKLALGKVPDRWIDIDRLVDGLQTMLDFFFNRVSNMVCLSRSSFSMWQEEKEFQAEVEAMVIAIYFRSLQDEFGERRNSCVCVNENIDFLKKKKGELSSLRQELDGLNKLLAAPDAGHITSHGSMEIGEECGNGGSGKVTDPLHLHRKLSGSHVFSCPLGEVNGQHEELTIAMSEDIDREEYFRLKKEYWKLRERGSSLLLKKDKDLDGLKRKIPEVILKLDEILEESDAVPSFSGDVEGFCNVKERLDALLLENGQLKDMLDNKKREIERLSAEVSDAGEKIFGYSPAEANLQEVIGKLKQEKEEVCIKATIREEVYQCFLRMLPTDISCIDDICTESDHRKVICENSCGEAVSDGQNSSESEIENLYFESVISQELMGFVFLQALKEAKEKFDCLSNECIYECIYEKVVRASFEEKALEKAELAQLEAVENQSLLFYLRVFDAQLKLELSIFFKTEDLQSSSLRLHLLGSELNCLTRDAKLLKLSYKQRLEKKCLDLEKAEKEVDLLGDEVENQLSLLEKIYIALDHYSPILKHYPGVMEILKLVKGELSGESLKRNDL